MIGVAFAALSRPTGPALHAVARERDGALVRALGDAHAFEPDRVACQVHHDEHVLEAAVLLADEVARGTALVAVREHARGARVDAELVLERDDVHVVARPERAVLVDEELGHDEERDALHAFRRVRRACEHEVDDVLGVVVLAERDEDLLSEQPVGAVALRHGARAHRREVGARLRLRQVHRARPRARDHLRQERVLELLRTAKLDRLDRALREQRAQVEREIGGMPHLLDRARDELRQPLPAVFAALGEPVPPVLAELEVGVLEALRRPDGAVGLQHRALAVAGHVERIQDVGRELGGLLEDRGYGVGRRILEAGKARDLGQAAQLVHHERHFGERRVVCAHGERPRVASTRRPLAYGLAGRRNALMCRPASRARR
jgi:hypothetical protein